MEHEADLTVRNADLGKLMKVLQDQSTRKVDVVMRAGALRTENAHLVLENVPPVLGASGVTTVDGVYSPNDICNQGIGDKLGIPGAYLRRLATDFPELYDRNVNGWLRRSDKAFLIRCLRSDSGDAPGDGSGVARAFLSDRFNRIDNIDVLMAALDGARSSGVNVQVDGCDLSERRMYVRLFCPEVQAVAPTLLQRYRSPFDGRSGSELPVVWGGFLLSNSETGCGAFSLKPRLIVQVCRNGMTMNEDALRSVHVGGKLDEGVIEWSEETLNKALELVTAKTRDAVRTYLTPEYVQRQLRKIEETAGKPIEEPDTTIKVVSQRLRFTEATQTSILSHFLKGGDPTAGGVLHAVTSVAQTLDDADAAFEMESVGLRAMELAAASA